MKCLTILRFYFGGAAIKLPSSLCLIFGYSLSNQKYKTTAKKVFSKFIITGKSLAIV